MQLTEAASWFILWYDQVQEVATMGKTAKVAISLPEHVLAAVEAERRAKGESRSEFFRRAAERRLEQEHESSAIRDYVRGYQQYPESADEVEAAHRAGAAVLASEPWE
jgi:Arc/MetJ-type ribon-helix-helix transcriptional regulator